MRVEGKRETEDARRNVRLITPSFSFVSRFPPVTRFPLPLFPPSPLTPRATLALVGFELLLTPLTPLYGALVRARAAAYRRGLVRRVRLPVPVVSVGNLTLGGTGKTPTVRALVRDLARRGLKPAVLTRGYGRRSGQPLVLVGPDVVTSAAQAGDEPVELAGHLPGVPVVVDRDRARGGAEAIRRGADVLLLDDGFQHLRLERDLDLVVMDAGDPWGGDALPPRGRLREPVAALGRASAILVNKLDADATGVPEAIARRLGALAPGVPVLGARLAPVRVRTPDSVAPPSALAGKRVLPFAGIGRPSGFVELLSGLGAIIADERWFPDHHRYGEADLASLEDAARRAGAAPVTTGKDAVKLPPGAPAWVVEVEVRPLGGSWDELWAAAPGILP